MFYRLDKVYAKAGRFADIQRALAHHRGARYLAVDYLRRETRRKEEYRDLIRARNRVAALIRHLLFKRFESSVAAFRSTLQVVIRSNRNFRAALDEGRVPIGRTATTFLSGEAFDLHDFIGLDARLLSESERLNPGAMYRIYEQKRLPDQDDVLDEVSAFQRGVALLQKIQQEDPELWRTVADLPDGIRSALPVRAPTGEFQALIDFQSAFPGLRDVQLPLGAPGIEAGVRSPLDAPQPGETVALFKHGERAAAYTVGADLSPRPITPGQLIAAMECEPGTPRQALPADTNRRVMVAYEAMRREAATRLGRGRRPVSDTRLRRYLSRHLRALREQSVEDPDELQRIGIFQQIFLGHLPTTILAELEEVRRMELTGPSLARRLEALRERHRLNPPDAEQNQAGPAEAEVIRIICSDALAGR
ncbi:MAG: hypothetical protein HY331_17735 [Chloroflexi bacterium]|nr:hypothetical protein [Chloroflexota bacterium]